LIKVTMKKVGGKKQLEFEGLVTQEAKPEPVGAVAEGGGDEGDSPSEDDA